MLLSDVLTSLYFPLNLHVRSANTRYQYQHALRSFAKSLGHPPTTADLTDDLVTIWFSRLLEEGKAVVTAREMVGRVLALWRWLAKRRQVDQFPTVCLPAAPETSPNALTEIQLRELFASAGRERGRISGIPTGLFFTSLLAFVWNTAERKSAALSCKVEWIDLATGACQIPPEVRKGKRKWGHYQLWPETVTLIRETLRYDYGRLLVWPWDRCKGAYYTTYDRILRDAGIPVNRHTKTHALRVSHATWLKALGGDATRALGHSSAETTDKFYIDSSKLPQEPRVLPIPWEGRTIRNCRTVATKKPRQLAPTGLGQSNGINEP